MKKINGGELEELAQSVGYKASNSSRRCRELAERGAIKREVIKGSVWYWYEPSMPVKQRETPLTATKTLTMAV